MPSLDIATASRFARIALAGAVREYPNKPDHVLTAAADARTPRELHPVFYGCYDWHSAVHTHWLMLRLIRCFPHLPERAAIEAHFDLHFQAGKMAAELAYAADPQRIAFERPYGWAWLFKLAEELHSARDERSQQWGRVLQPLSTHFVEQLMQWLPKQDYPVRSGVHSNTAFMLAFALDYARSAGLMEGEKLIATAAMRLYFNDRAAPVHHEPSGHDFLSPSLIEADLMRRVVTKGNFAAWCDTWLPDLSRSPLLTPVKVSDRADPHGGHLDGLNLSRSWCLRALAASGVGEAASLEKAAECHLEAGLEHVESGNFLGEHWLASFAVYAMTRRP
ncbi:MAG: DUF2891 domain-containing protein [Betaproteobacteria bacterium]|nr:DUF2891 domain-containing protein [Betaproteobacteria bacterium]